MPTSHSRFPTPAPAGPQLVSLVRPLRVIDGDTVEVETVPHRLRVRLLDCWAPELRKGSASTKAAGRASREHLGTLIADHAQLLLQVPGNLDLTQLSTLGRILGRLWIPGRPPRDVSALQVAAGHAAAEGGSDK